MSNNDNCPLAITQLEFRLSQEMLFYYKVLCYNISLIGEYQ